MDPHPLSRDFIKASLSYGKKKIESSKEERTDPKPNAFEKPIVSESGGVHPTHFFPSKGA